MRSTSTRKTTILALGATLALGLTACGGDAEDSTGSGSGSTPEASASPSPVAAIDNVQGESTAVTLDPAFVEGITMLGLTPGVSGKAEFDATAGTVSFPISGGEVAYFDPASGVTPFVQGQLNHEMSALSLTAEGGPMVELSDFVVDPEESVATATVTVDGEVAAEGAPVFFLDGSTLNPLEANESEGTAVLQGTTVSLTAEAAELLNMTFGVDALTEFFPVGVATITLTLPSS